MITSQRDGSERASWVLKLAKGLAFKKTYIHFKETEKELKGKEKSLL